MALLLQGLGWKIYCLCRAQKLMENDCFPKHHLAFTHTYRDTTAQNLCKLNNGGFPGCCGVLWTLPSNPPTLPQHQTQSPSSHLMAAQGRWLDTGQQPLKSSWAESKVWLSPLSWHTAHKEGKEARARPTRSLTHISPHWCHQSQNKLALPLTQELLQHTMAALRTPHRHPVQVLCYQTHQAELSLPSHLSLCREESPF